MALGSRIKRGRFLDPSEVGFLRYGLGLERDAVTIKRALQSVCQHYEADRVLSDATEVRQLIHSHLGSDDVILRRWSMKALGLIGSPDDTRRLIDRLKVESDLEAQTWGVAAISKTARDQGLEEICQEAGLTKSSALVLAARLYAPRSWIAKQNERVRISLHDDELTLKWATFLIGYGRAPEELFHPRFSNDIFLGELNTHTSNDISEYSMWALWERPDYDAGRLTLSLHEARLRPENVRKWLYRLATQSPDIVGLDVETFAELDRDRAVPAREGLALGVQDLDPAVYADEVLDWYGRESGKTVRDILLASMATRSGSSEEYRSIVATKFQEEQPDSPLRRRLLAASVATPLSGDLKRIEARDLEAKRGLQLFDAANVTLIGGMNVTTGPTFNVAGNLNANNLVVGDMIASANQAVQSLRADDGAIKAVLEQVLALLRDTEAPDDAKREVAAAAEIMAREPTDQNRKSLMGKVLGYGKAVAGIGGLVGGIDKIVEALQNLPL